MWHACLPAAFLLPSCPLVAPLAGRVPQMASVVNRACLATTISACICDPSLLSCTRCLPVHSMHADAPTLSAEPRQGPQCPLLPALCTRSRSAQGDHRNECAATIHGSHLTRLDVTMPPIPLVGLQDLHVTLLRTVRAMLCYGWCIEVFARVRAYVHGLDARRPGETSRWRSPLGTRRRKVKFAHRKGIRVPSAAHGIPDPLR
jgi:hypothetical protein